MPVTIVGSNTPTAGGVVYGDGTNYASTAAGTSGQVLTSNGADAPGWTTVAPSSGTLQATASGALNNGSTVVVNADGTVSVVAGQNQGFGSPAVFNAVLTAYIAATYDSANNKVVIVYRNVGSSNYGTAVVGTVSGTSISFGSPALFNAGSSGFNSITYDSTNQKVVVAYQDFSNSSYGTAVVGTVSGTSISFGSEVVFNSANTRNTSSVYDSANQKVVIAYTDVANAGYGTVVVGTVSGTLISFGAEVAFTSTSTNYVSAVYDSANQKIVIAYADEGNLNYGTVVVGTVSGTSISFGTPAIFNSANTAYISTVYDSTNQKVIISYTDNGNSSYGTAVVGAVSGTDFFFDPPVIFSSSSTSYVASAYDSAYQKVVIVYRNVGNAGYGTVVVGTVSGTSISFGAPIVSSNTAGVFAPVYNSASQKIVVAYQNNDLALGHGTAVVFQNQVTNLTATNYIGISSAAYTNGQTATIQTAGAVDDAQSSLTAGKAYYVQADGTLSQTPITPSVFAGTAVSATKLIVKG